MLLINIQPNFSYLYFNLGVLFVLESYMLYIIFSPHPNQSYLIMGMGLQYKSDPIFVST